MLFLLSSVIQHSYIYIYTSTKECRERRDLVRRVSVPQALDWFGDWVLINPPPVCMVSHPHHVLVVSCMGRLAGSKITTPHARCSLHHLGAGVAHQLYESHTTTAGGCLASRRTGGAAHCAPRQYRRLCLQWHPDKSEGGRERFEELQVAHRFLTDEVQKEATEGGREGERERERPLFGRPRERHGKSPRICFLGRFFFTS